MHTMSVKVSDTCADCRYKLPTETLPFLLFFALKLLQMTRYKQADFADEDTSSIGSRSLNETTTIPTMHIRYHTAQVNPESEFTEKTFSFGFSLFQFVFLRSCICRV